MSYPVRLDTIRDRVRELADAEGTSGSGWMSDAKLLKHINAAVGKYHTLLVQAHPELYTTYADITANGATEYALPADWYATMAVEVVDGDTRRELIRATWDERNNWGNGSGEAVAFIVVGSNLWLRPAPASGTYRHWYVQHATELAADSDTFEGHNGWEDYVAISAAIALKTKEESDPSSLIVMQRDIRQAMESAARNRKSSNPPRVTDVRPMHLRTPYTGGRYGDIDFWRLRS